MARRRGRKRKVAQREGNGRVQRDSAKQREQVLSVVLGQRVRIFGVSLERAKVMSETSYLGYLRAIGDRDGISARQYEAALAYEAHCRAYDALHPVKGYPQPGNYDKTGGHDSSDGTEQAYVQQFRRVVEQRQRVQEAMWSAEKQDWRSPGAVEAIVLKGMAQPHLIGPLRIGLNTLAKAFGIPAGGTMPERDSVPA